MNNSFIMEAETVNAGTKFIIIAQQQVGEHTDKQFVKTEARQRCTPTEKGSGCPLLVRRKAVKRR